MSCNCECKAPKLNLVLHKNGDSYQVKLATEKEGEDFDFTDYSAVMYVKRDISSSRVIYTFSSTNGTIVLSAGQILISQSASILERYKGDFVYSFFLTDPLDNTVEYFQGTFSKCPDLQTSGLTNVPPVPVTLVSIALSGPDTINEGESANYVVTGTYSDGTTANITSAVSAAGGLSASEGTLLAGTLTIASNQATGDDRTITLTANFLGLQATLDVDVADTTGESPTLQSIEVTGPASINEGSSGIYTVTATYSDSSTADVTAQTTFESTEGTFTDNSLSIASNDTTGDDRTATITATYQGQTDTLEINIVDTTDNGGNGEISLLTDSTILTDETILID